VENEWCLKSVRFQQESLSAFKRGGCPFSARTAVRFGQEYAECFILVDFVWFSTLCISTTGQYVELPAITYYSMLATVLFT
jgi:hypothetical protein